ncbi:hypothetical protein HanXRQr2_Chr15g0677191 [Helianthus annuus]|uniref:Uncharacterized protein n=1 Tax=Helianthus annuus TaxID=4232 RepID=A0A9K3DX65_HELAN|nr:hypothetical protein HanXRQr2_Chr15g0677191 [Helianthus annuus]KAJ0829915.1 hypothetical protein HanPSC8_Chr15g0649231 [Helianthus annuus]
MKGNTYNRTCYNWNFKTYKRKKYMGFSCLKGLLKANLNVFIIHVVINNILLLLL